MKRILNDYFTFSRKERIAVVILCVLIIACWVLAVFFSTTVTKPLSDETLAAFMAKAAAADSVNGAADNDRTDLFAKKSTEAPVLFYFDPNTISADGWRKLGLTEKTTRTIQHYLGKGGRFREPADIRKIWGMPPALADKLLSFVQITKVDGDAFNGRKKTIVPVQKDPVMIDINTATEEQWQSLPGIGEGLAKKIIHYRELTGGFINTGQIRKTYGINDSVYRLITPYISTNPATIPKTDLNQAGLYELKTKAGIPEEVAKAILIYRQQYGPFSSLAELKKIVFINDSLYQKLIPLLKVN